MREQIVVDRIKCENCVAKLANALAPLKGINEARIELGSSSLLVDYEEGVREPLDEAIAGAGFSIVERIPATS